MRTRLLGALLPLALATLHVTGVPGAQAAPAEPGPLPAELRDELKLPEHYQKHSAGLGLPVVGSSRVSDNALAEAAWIVEKMLAGREDIVKAMRANRVRVVVMAHDEFTTDVPEHSGLKPKLFWDRRARGLGATRSNPVVSCGEENLLGFPNDPYPNENIFVHEFAHAIHGTGLSTTDPTFDRRLRSAYQSALDRGLWRNTYAATNHSEYWAEGVQCWFDDNAPPDALHNDVRTRAQLRQYDPALAGLCEEVFGDGPWRYLRPAARPAEERQHLKDYDPRSLPTFRWREAPLGDRPRATVQTAIGDFDVELDAKNAPEAAALFLRTALVGGYHSARFERLLRSGSDTAGKFAVAAVKPGFKPALKELETIKPAADSPAPNDEPIVAYVRAGDDAGGLAIGLGPLPEHATALVPIGKVIKGKDVVKSLLATEDEAGAFKKPIDIRRVIRNE
jgi:cyclophilin family peptidyl-prolyl cis-trans isomerase